MKTSAIYFITLSCFLLSCKGKSQQPMSKEQDQSAKGPISDVAHRTDEEWKKILSPEQFYVLREKGTESPFTGKYLNQNDKGVYTCAACGYELFNSDMKCDSHCGWPSFDKEIEGGRIKKQVDKSAGMVRTEILCGRCGGHIGHLFDDGPTETGMRYCVNSVSLGFKKEK